MDEPATPDQPQPRIAGSAFEILSRPSSVAIIDRLGITAVSRGDLLASLGTAPTTLDSHLNRLQLDGVIQRTSTATVPRTSLVSLTESGRALVSPLLRTARWMRQAGFNVSGTGRWPAPRTAHLVAWAWQHGLFDSLSERPQTVTYLISQVEARSASTVATRIRDLLGHGIVEATPRRRSRENLISLTNVGNRVVGPLIDFIRWELLYRPGARKLLGPRDVWTAMRMAIALIDPDLIPDGRYALAVPLREHGEVGISFSVTGESISHVTHTLDTNAIHRISGHPLPWIASALDNGSVTTKGRPPNESLLITDLAHPLLWQLYAQLNGDPPEVDASTELYLNRGYHGSGQLGFAGD